MISPSIKPLLLALSVIVMVVVAIQPVAAWQYVPGGDMEIADYYPHYVNIRITPPITGTPVIVSPQNGKYCGSTNDPAYIKYTDNESLVVFDNMITCVKYKISVPYYGITNYFYPFGSAFVVSGDTS